MSNSGNDKYTSAGVDGDISQMGVSQHLPSHLVWLGNQLSSSASRHYRNTFGVGIEVWRVLVMLNSYGSVSAQMIGRVMGMDKGAVSRTIGTMRARNLIKVATGKNDRRMQIITLTAAGHDLFARMEAVAREREKLFLQALDEKEQAKLRSILSRLQSHLPKIEDGTLRFLTKIKRSGR